MHMGGVSRASRSALRLGPQSILTHQPLDPFAAAANPPRLQRCIHAGTAIAPLAGPVDRADFHSESLIGLRSLPSASLLSGIEAGPRNPTHAAHQRDLERAPLRVHTGGLQRDARAKEAAAFFRKAFSCVACSSARRKLRIASAWLVSFPLPGKPSPPVRPARRSACRFHVCTMAGRMPHARATGASGFACSLARRTASSLHAAVHGRRFAPMDTSCLDSPSKRISVSIAAGEFQWDITDVDVLGAVEKVVQQNLWHK